MRHLILAIVFTTSFASAQQIVRLDKFEPFELIGDTLHFNRNGYDVVLVTEPYWENWWIKTKKPDYYKNNFYILKNDHNDLEGMLKIKHNLQTSIWSHKNYKKFKCRTGAGTGGKYGKDLYYQFTINSDKSLWDIKIEEHYLDPLNKEKPQVQSGHYKLPLDLMDDKRNLLDSVVALFNYQQLQNYAIEINVGSTQEAEITPNDLCSDYNTTKIPNTDLTQLEKTIASFDWPTLKMHTQVEDYTLATTTSYESVISKKIRKETKNGYPESIRVFKQPESLFAIVDSFNDLTTFYLIDPDDRYIMSKYTRFGVWEIDSTQYTDINNDGLLDLILFSGSLKSDKKTLSYIPCYPLKKKSGYYGNPYGSHLNREFYFQQSLGHHIYYDVAISSEYKETTSIYLMKNDKKIHLIKYSKGFKKRRYGNHRRKRIDWERSYTYDLQSKLRYSYTVRGNSKMSGKTKSSKIAYEKKSDLYTLINYYLDHPDQLFLDFKIKK
jgi:hypothetical protein